MKVTYTFQTTAICPVDGSTDVYAVEVRTDRPIEVEKILLVAESFRESRIYQEVLTERFCDALRADVTLTGTHSGVLTVSRCVTP